MKKMTKTILVILALGASVFSCDKKPSEPVLPTDPDKLLVVVDGISSYSIAFAGNMDNAKGLAAALKDKTGVEMAYYRETTKTEALEILLGRTARPETAEALSAP